MKVLLAGVAAAGLAVPALAQDVKGEDGAPDEDASENKADAPILVTGTRIRGARIVGETIRIERNTIVEAGQVDLGEAIRSLPQNFSGGQNPGVGSGSGLINQNINSASSANLRGLGPDATLTLLNGHRLPYNSAFQGIDISAIPLAAVERIDVLPDGASALYGSDAVGGVINVVLRRDFDGIATSAQLGTSTSGGNFRQQADIVAGTVWDGGGVVAAYDFASNSGIEARQRTYTSTLLPETSLFPAIERHAVTLSAHHDPAPGVEISIDALYSRRTSEFFAGTPQQGIARDPATEGYTLAPSALIDLGSGWEARLLGVFGRDDTHFRSTFLPASGPSRVASGQYLNEIVSLETGAEGPLLALPGGDARLAVGIGFRNNSLRSETLNGARSFAFDETQRARFGYAELYLPLVSDANRTAGISQLTFSGALRYEDYPGLDGLAVPRFAVSYSPVESLTLRGSWARSFKAPTLFQQFTFFETILLPAAAFGAGTSPQSVFFASGGNPDVRPERSRSWTVGAEWRPQGAPDLLVSATFYDIDYDDRVTSPITGSLAAALSNPGFAEVIDRSPDPAQLAGLISGAPFGLQNLTGFAFDPANVVAFIDNRNLNVASWAVRGVDARLAWNRKIGAEQSVGFDLTGTWTDSSQTLTDALPAVQLSGAVFNPPRYRARGTARYRAGPFSANLAVNYIGALEDRRFAETQRISPSGIVDLGMTYRLLGSSVREPGLEVSLSVQNLFNDEPNIIAQTGPTDTPFDATNYSAIGRFVAFGIRRHW